MSNDIRQKTVQIPVPPISSTTDPPVRIMFTVNIGGERPHLRELLRSASENLTIERMMVFRFESDLGETVKSSFTEKLLLTHLSLSGLSGLYIIRGSREVFEFLANNAHLSDIVMMAHNAIRRYFKSEKLSLEVVSDTEDQDSHLVISIHTREPPHVAIEKLDRFDRDWWFSVSSRENVAGKLSVTPVFE